MPNSARQHIHMRIANNHLSFALSLLLPLYVWQIYLHIFEIIKKLREHEQKKKKSPRIFISRLSWKLCYTNICGIYYVMLE